MQQKRTEEPLVSQFQRMDFFKDNAVAQSLVTKFVPAIANRQTRGNGKDDVIPDQSTLERISKMVASDIDDASNMMQIHTDLGLAREIMVSLIIAPKDLLTHKLIWGTGKCDLPTGLVGAITECLSTYFEQGYKINDLLIPACEDALFNTGSYPLVIIPESSLDDIINQNGRISVESLQTNTAVFESGHVKNRGILGPGTAVESTNGVTRVVDSYTRKGYGIESLTGLSHLDVRSNPWFDGNIRILDSTDNLKLPHLQERLTQEMLRDRMNYGNISMESLDRDEELERLQDALFVRRPTRNIPVITVDRSGNGSRLPKGHPLVMKLPSESIIPVHTPGAPTDHLGYFVMIDEFGNPVTRAQSQDYYKQLTNNMNTKMDNYNSQAKTLLSNVQSFMGPNCETSKFDGMQLLNAYTGMLKYEVLTRLKRGLYGENVELSDVAEQVYTVMLARTLANLHTSLLYVPVEQCTYIAFDYNNAGCGKSLLSDVKVLAALRSTLLFTDTMIALKNAVPHRKVTLGLDETDPDPDKTIALIQNEFAKTLNYSFPLGVTDPKEQIDMLQKSGVSWEISGHPQYPTTSLQVDITNSTFQRIEPEFAENIRNMIFMGIGIPPEIVDSSLNIEFAASVYSSNLLLAKRSAQKQQILTGFMEDFVRKYVLSSGTLFQELQDIINNHRDELRKMQREGDEPLRYSAVIKMYLDALKLKLPAADQARVKTQLEAVNDQLALYDALIPAVLNDTVLREMMGDEFSQYSDSVIQAVRSNLIIDWMVQENIAPEIQKLVRKADDDNPGYDFLTARLEHVNALAATVANYVKRISERNGGSLDNGGSDDTSGGTDTDGDTGDGGLFGGDFDDFGATPDDTENPPDGGAAQSDTPTPEENTEDDNLNPLGNTGI
jgi:hypothetical protein